ncbi:MAG: bifunctional DNA primase/polymerase [Anaerolineaceae bacterium]
MTEMTEVYSQAKKWVSSQIPVLPVVYQSKRAMVGWEQYQSVLPTWVELANWFYSPMRNLGVVVGNGLAVIDFDVQDVFDYWHTEFCAKYPQGTFMVKTRRGVHVYIKSAIPAKNYHNDLLDVKAERGYVLAPPSIHPSGFAYRILSDKPILRVDKLSDVLPEFYTPEPETSNQYDCAFSFQRYSDPFEEADNAREHDLRAIRERYSMLDFLKGVRRSDRGGRWFVALCPFHDDRSPSFWVDEARKVGGCRKCNIKIMDVINLFGRLNHISNTEAIRILGEGI